MSTMIRPASRTSVQPGRLLGARQLADVVRRLAATSTGHVLAKPVGAGGSRAFGPRYIHDVRNTAAAVAVSVHAYSPPLPQMTRYDLTPAGLVKLATEGAASW